MVVYKHTFNKGNQSFCLHQLTTLNLGCLANVNARLTRYMGSVGFSVHYPPQNIKIGVMYLYQFTSHKYVR